MCAFENKDFTTDHHEKERKRAAEQNVAHIVRASGDTADCNDTRERDRYRINDGTRPFFVADALHEIGQTNKGVNKTCRISVSRRERLALVGRKHKCRARFRGIRFAFSVAYPPVRKLSEFRVACGVHRSETHAADGTFHKVYDKIARHCDDDNEHPFEKSVVGFGLDARPGEHEACSFRNRDNRRNKGFVKSALHFDLNGDTVIERRRDRFRVIFENVLQRQKESDENKDCGNDRKPDFLVGDAPPEPYRAGNRHDEINGTTSHRLKEQRENARRNIRAFRQRVFRENFRNRQIAVRRDKCQSRENHGEQNERNNRFRAH